jgi:hypothetical protein
MRGVNFCEMGLRARLIGAQFAVAITVAGLMLNAAVRLSLARRPAGKVVESSARPRYYV